MDCFASLLVGGGIGFIVGIVVTGSAYDSDTALKLANCIEHIYYNEGGDHITLTQDFQNLVKAKEEFVEEAVRQGVLKENI